MSVEVRMSSQLRYMVCECGRSSVVVSVRFRRKGHSHLIQPDHTFTGSPSFCFFVLLMWEFPCTGKTYVPQSVPSSHCWFMAYLLRILVGIIFSSTTFVVRKLLARLKIRLRSAVRTSYVHPETPAQRSKRVFRVQNKTKQNKTNNKRRSLDLFYLMFDALIYLILIALLILVTQLSHNPQTPTLTTLFNKDTQQ
jgi:hypothetical protein